MIPTRATDIDACIAELARLSDEVRSTVAGLGTDQLHWKPPGKWSVIQHVEHMPIVHEPYFDVIERTLANDPPRGSGPYKHPWFGKWFANSMQPPPKRRIKTLKVMIPPPDPDPDEALRRFNEVHERMGQIMKASEGVDLGRARITSPFSRLIRLSIGTAFGTMIFHTARHLWLAQEVIAWEGFPSSSEG